MNIKYMKDDALQTIKNNLDYIFCAMQESDSNEWVDKIIPDCFGESKIIMPIFEMDMSFKNPNHSDLTNAKIIYEAFKNLNETQATDERLWAGLAFGKCYDYLIYRWGKKEITKLAYRWVYKQNVGRAIYYHGLSRLWWFSKMTYDDTLDNSYELTEFVFSHPQIMKALTYRNYSNSETIRKAIISSMMEAENLGIKMTISIIDEIYKRISLLGSASILDSYSEDELNDKIFIIILEVYSKINNSKDGYK